MAANKFATMLHNRTNRFTLILIYALLEWVLIVLLLLNSLFFYLILKFADYFGLQRPCLWCSRLDHVLEPHNSTDLYRRLVCEPHALEISDLAYCSNHRKLSDSLNMCPDCSASPSFLANNRNSKITFTIRDGAECGDDTELRCSCCDASLEASKFKSPYFLIRPSWEALGDVQKPSFVAKAGGGGVVEGDINKEAANSEQSRSDLVFQSAGDEMGSVLGGGFHIAGAYEDKQEAKEDAGCCKARFSTRTEEQVEEEELLTGGSFSLSSERHHLSLPLDEAAYIGHHREEESALEFYIDSDDFRLIPVGRGKRGECEGLGEFPGENSDGPKASSGLQMHTDKQIGFGSGGMSTLGQTVALLETLDSEENHQAATAPLAHDGDTNKEVCEELDVPQATQRLSDQHGDGAINSSHFPTAFEDANSMCNGKIEAELPIKAEVPDGEPMHEFQPIQEHPSATTCTLHADDSHADEMVRGKNISVEAEISAISDITDGERVDELQKIQEKLSTYSCALHADDSHADGMVRGKNISVEADISAISDITDGKRIDELQEIQEKLSTYSCALHADDSHGSKQVVDGEGKGISIEAEISMKSEITDGELIDELKNLQEEPSTNSCTLQTEDSHGSKQAVNEMVEDKNISVDADISIKSEITNGGRIDELQNIQEDPSTNSCTLHADDSHGCMNIPLEMSEQTVDKHLSLDNLHEVEEDKVPDSPNSADILHKKIQTLEKREWETEESLDGSVVSEFETSEGILTMEHLKSVLKAERKSLNVLYVELEEERSASAVAANQTMAMINRLQEEKAAVQMELLHYQRVMEEQSEYDQEALRLLNEIMVKRERENHELEKELKIYRRKVMDYEAKERMAIMRRRESRDGSARSQASSASCSNCEDSDGQSIDLNPEGKEEESICNHHESGKGDGHMFDTPADVLFNLDDSMDNFEEERLSILEQLRDLEEKLFTLSDEEEQHIDVMNPLEQFYEESGKELVETFKLGGELNGFPNGKHHREGRIMGSKAKTLLPLFDDISAENGVASKAEEGFNSVIVPLPSSATKFKLEGKNQAIEEEVDHLYERLQALEADREFLKHCIGSLKKGEKGTDLLQEILQHLRDLKNVELRVRSMSDGPLV